MTAPMPSLHYYADDAEAMARAIETRGIHPDEAGVVAYAIRALLDEIEALGVEDRSKPKGRWE